MRLIYTETKEEVNVGDLVKTTAGEIRKIMRFVDKQVVLANEDGTHQAVHEVSEINAEWSEPKIWDELKKEDPLAKKFMDVIDEIIETKIKEALNGHDFGQTIRDEIDNYDFREIVRDELSECDFEDEIDTYLRNHPNEIVDIVKEEFDVCQIVADKLC